MSEETELRKCRQTLEEGENVLEIWSYKRDVFKTVVTHVAYLLTLGLLRLLYHWYPHFLVYSTHKIAEFERGETIVVIDVYKEKHKSYYVEKIRDIRNFDGPGIFYTLSNGLRRVEKEIRYFECKKNRYVYDEEVGSFFKLVGIDYLAVKCELFKSEGFDESSRISRALIYGKNAMEVPFQSIFKLFILEALTPFYIFQVFSLIVWFAEQYYYYTIAIVLMSAYGITSSIIQTRRNQTNLRGTVGSTDYVEVFSNGIPKKLDSTDLVPGDVIVIPKVGCVLHCDAVLLSGSCVVNESMLTGESVPVLKTSLESSGEFFNEKEDANHTLYSGTTIIQARNNSDLPVKAVVVRTAFLTSKGELVKSILYPPPADFKFERDSYKYIAILAVIAISGFLYTIVSKSYRHVAVWDTIIKALDIITITIPPALPAALTIGKLFALNRLKAKDIFCMNSRVINISGAINCVCFDKTGTLTEDGLDLHGIILKENIPKNLINNPKSLTDDSEMLKSMATCHSLTKIEDHLSGDPLDIKMFESTNFNFDSNLITNSAGCKLEILHQYQFSSNLQRMSVLVKDHSTNTKKIYCKGSPEVILQLSNENSVPQNIKPVLNMYTEKGYRVLALATKIFRNEEELTRNFAESQLDFLGLMIFENKLKPESAEIIRILKRANVKVAMITGDNIQTAISVAKECGIIEKNSRIADVEVRNVDKLGGGELVFNFHRTYNQSDEATVALTITGQNWHQLKANFPNEIRKVVSQGLVFARMNSDQKRQLIVELQSLGYYVAMCGDGTNDCGALKAAHIGISLSESDASVASPFTSKTPNISCVREVVKEGRAALVTSFGVFKFMLCYSLTEFISVIILYGIDSNLTSLQFLFIDICLALNFASLFGYTKAYEKELYPKTPCTSLLSFVPLMSLIMHTILVIAFQTISYYVIKIYDFYVPFVYDPDRLNYFASYENYAIFSISLFQYIITAVVFSKGKPYRKNIFTNYYLLASLVIMTIVCSYMVLWPANWIIDVLEMKIPPNVYPGLVILLIGALNFLVAYIFEDFFVDGVLTNKVQPRVFKEKVIRENLGYKEWKNISSQQIRITMNSDDYNNCHYNRAYVEDKG